MNGLMVWPGLTDATAKGFLSDRLSKAALAHVHVVAVILNDPIPAVHSRKCFSPHSAS